jgi:type II pantothenate kinase
MSREDRGQLVAGIDVGASTTKGVILGKTGIMHKCFIETSNGKSSAMRVFKILLSLIDDVSVVKKVAVSGCYSRMIGKTLLGVPAQKVDEIAATGIGGLLLSGKRQALIVSVGTGTAIIAALDGGKKLNHVGGTGVGGGTVMGLASKMLGINDFKALEILASKGNANKVDLTVGDIVGGPVGIVPAEATASNLARLDNKTLPEDVAAGIFNLVSQVVGVVSVMAAKSCNLDEDIVFVGRLVQSPLVSNIISQTAKMFGLKAFVPENGEYCTALGATTYILRNS